MSTSTSASGRLRRFLSAGVGVTVLAAGALAAGAVVGPVAGARPAPSGATIGRQPDTVAPDPGDVHYALERPVCAMPKDPTHARCLAIRRVDVAKGTPGAVRYVRAAGISYGPAGGYTPQDLATAYHYNPSSNRTNQTVAIVGWEDAPTALRDLNAFDRHYGFHVETSRSFRKVNQQGHTSPLPAPSRDSATETALDIESVRSVCRTCRILLVEARSGTDFNLAAAENTAARLGATEISNSFGSPEHKVSSSVVNGYKHPGVVITASTGDDGWYGWDRFNDFYVSDGRASFPSTSPYVVAVGGTSLVLGSGATRTNEYVWNANGPDDVRGFNDGQGRARGATGGGCSKTFRSPAWQAYHVGYRRAGCHSDRLAADVAVIGDPRFGFDALDTYGVGGWATFGGTSLSSPVAAAMFALAGGSGGSAYPAAALYTNAIYRPAALFDITAGGNAFCAGDGTSACKNQATAISRQHSRKTTANPNLIGAGVIDCSYPRTSGVSGVPPLSAECNALPGYDGASGIGSPASLGIMLPTTGVVAIGRARYAHKGRSTEFVANIHQRVRDTVAVAFGWNFGDGRTASTRGRTVHHVYRTPGVYRLTVTVADSRHQYAVRTIRFRVR